MSNTTITPEDCAEIRQNHSFVDGFEPLLETYDIQIQTLQEHLYGECSHNIDIDPIVPPSERKVTAKKCQLWRKIIPDDTSVVELAEKEGRDRQTITYHVTGECTHSIDTAAVDRESTYIRDKVSAERCNDLRRRFSDAETDNVVEFAKQVNHSYQVTLTHLSGDCNHDVEMPARKKLGRGSNITEKKCNQMRAMWHDNPDITFDELATEFDNSPQAIERHIKFDCSHEPDQLLVDDMEIFSDYLN